MRRKSETISFRADEHLMRLIDAERDVFGVSRGDYTRGVLTAHVLRNRESEINQRLIELDQSIRQLEDQLLSQTRLLNRMTLAMLTVIGNLPPDEARTITTKVFGGDPGVKEPDRGSFHRMHEG